LKQAIKSVLTLCVMEIPGGHELAGNMFKEGGHHEWRVRDRHVRAKHRLPRPDAEEGGPPLHPWC